MNLWHIYISLLGYSSNGELGDGAVSRKNNIPVPESALDGLDFACPGVITTHQQKALTVVGSCRPDDRVDIVDVASKVPDESESNA